MKYSSGLPLFSKLVFYGLCGFFTEVVFTSMWYFFDRILSGKQTYHWTFHGCTSLWSFPMYGLCILIMEKMFLRLKDKLVLPIRVIIYVCWTYAWEFATGLFLRQFNACPWNYEGHTSYNIMGLITFDYAPFWSVGAVMCEKIVIQNALRLQYVPDGVKFD